MGIPAFATSSDKVLKMQQLITDRVTSLDKSVIKRSGNKEQLVHEINKFRRYNDVDVPSVNTNLHKDVIVSQLCATRHVVFKSHPTSREELLQEALENLPSIETSREARLASVNHPYLSFYPELRKVTEFKEKFAMADDDS